jgi:hypothetical protein
LASFGVEVFYEEHLAGIKENDLRQFNDLAGFPFFDCVRRQAANNRPSTTAWRHAVIPAGFWRESSHTVIRSVSGPGFPPEACGNDDRNVR